MKKIHCSGCGMSEPLDTLDHKIVTVTLTVAPDSREWAHTPTQESDLCEDCIGRLLHNYFGVSAKGSLETPAFVAPRSLRVAG